MAYHNETTGAISKAIVELSHISQSMPSLVESERVEIININAAAELDKLHHEVNQLRSKVAILESAAAQEGFTLEVFWNGNFSGYSCPVCFNGRERGHTEGCSWHTSRITMRAADVCPLCLDEKYIPHGDGELFQKCPACNRASR